MCPNGENAALTEQRVFFAGCQQRHLRDALTGRDNNQEEEEEAERQREKERERTMISSTYVASETKPSHIAVRGDAMRLRSLLHSSSSVLSVQSRVNPRSQDDFVVLGF